MQFITREFTITWKGRDYTFIPTLRLLRQIESEGNLSIMVLAAEAGQGRPQTFLLSFLLYKVLSAAGAKVTEDEIAAEIWSGNPESAQELYGLFAIVMEAISPIVSEKKPAAPAE